MATSVLRVPAPDWTLTDTELHPTKLNLCGIRPNASDTDGLFAVDGWINLSKSNLAPLPTTEATLDTWYEFTKRLVAGCFQSEWNKIFVNHNWITYIASSNLIVPAYFEMKTIYLEAELNFTHLPRRRMYTVPYHLILKHAQEEPYDSKIKKLTLRPTSALAVDAGDIRASTKFVPVYSFVAQRGSITIWRIAYDKQPGGA